MTDPTPTRRFRPTPAWLIFGLLVVECLLWLSELHRWFWLIGHKGWTVLIAVAVAGGAMLVLLLWFLVCLVFRWRFQFSIRSLLVLAAAVAVPCSWLAVELKNAREQHAAVKEWEKAGCVTLYRIACLAPGVKPDAPAWLRKLASNEFFADAIPTRVGESHSKAISNRQLLINGWTHEQVEDWFGWPSEIYRSGFMLPPVDLIPTLPAFDEEWCYFFDSANRFVFFNQGTVVAAAELWKNFGSPYRPEEDPGTVP